MGRSGKFLSCPFCGGQSIACGANDANFSYSAGCCDCGVEGPLGQDNAEALSLWNSRVRTQREIELQELSDELLKKGVHWKDKVASLEQEVVGLKKTFYQDLATFSMRHGKRIRSVIQMIAAVESGKQCIMVGLDFVVVSREKYDALLSKKYKGADHE